MIRAGLVRLNGAAASAADIVRAGDTVEISTIPAAPSTPAVQVQPDTPPIEVLYADDDLVVVNKPPGMTVHPAPGHPGGTLVDVLLARFPEMAAMAEPDGVMRPGIVHRLDKDTSGVMVVARTAFARMELARQFKERTTKKIYLAVARGRVAREHLSISRPIGRHPVERKRMSVNSRHGRDALSEIFVLARTQAGAGSAGLSLLAVLPLTGRTHQIRVHLASIGHPCIGDPLYGGRVADAPIGRQALHALSLRLFHPRNGAPMRFVAHPPDDFAVLLAKMGVDATGDQTQRWLETVQVKVDTASQAPGRRSVDSLEVLR